MSDGLPANPAVDYDWKVSARKGWHTALLVGGVFVTTLLPEVLTYLASEENVATMLNHVNPNLVRYGLATALAGLIRVWLNYRKQTKD